MALITVSVPITHLQCHIINLPRVHFNLKIVCTVWEERAIIYLILKQIQTCHGTVVFVQVLRSTGNFKEMYCLRCCVLDICSLFSAIPNDF